MSSTIPYIGSKISLVSNSEIRYEGILYTINTQESTIALQSVRSFGTEGRKVPEIPPSSEIYDFIIFRGQDIKDLTVLEGKGANNSPQWNDPAILSTNQRPPAGPSGGKGYDRGPAASYGGGKSNGSKGKWDRDTGSGGYHAASGSWGPSKGSNKGTGGNSGKAWGDFGSHEVSSRGYDARGGGKASGKTSLKGKDAKGMGKGGKDDYKGGKWDSYPKGKSKGKELGKGGSENKGKGKKGGKSGEGKGDNDRGKAGRRGGRRSGGGGGVAGNANPIGELIPEENAAVKREVAEEFDVENANRQFEKLNADSEEANKESALSGYDKSKSFFDNISCEATERPATTDRQKVDRDKARQFDRETFGNTRRPPRPTAGGSGRGGGKGGKGKGGNKGSDSYRS